jgi:hypothetical protein
MVNTLSAYGVHIINLKDDHIGISFNYDDEQLFTDVYTTIDVLSSTFNIDHVHDGKTFLLNYKRLPTRRLATLFTFISSLSAGLIQYNVSNFVDGEHLRMKHLGY